MPFVSRSDFSSDLSAIQQLPNELVRQQQSALKSIGFSLVAKQRQHFNQLTKTGSSNGVTWPAPAPATIARRRTLQRRGLLPNADPNQSGRVTGELGNSFRFSVRKNSVVVVNTSAHANFFNVKRPLMPTAMPAEWQASSEAIVQRSLDRLSISRYDSQGNAK